MIFGIAKNGLFVLLQCDCGYVPPVGTRRETICRKCRKQLFSYGWIKTPESMSIVPKDHQLLNQRQTQLYEKLNNIVE